MVIPQNGQGCFLLFMPMFKGIPLPFVFTAFCLSVVEYNTFCVEVFSSFFFYLNLTAMKLDVCSGIMEKFRIFRTEKTYAVKTGKWYFEFEAVTAGDMRVGWTRPGCLPDQELGSDEEAFVFDGFKVCICSSVITEVIAKLKFASYSVYYCLN